MFHLLKNLRKLRDKTGTTQKQLAEAVNVSQQSINKYENHNIEPYIETLMQIADYFDVSVDYLIGHNENSADAIKSDHISLSSNEAQLIEEYRKLSNNKKGIIKLLIENLRD